MSAPEAPRGAEPLHFRKKPVVVEAMRFTGSNYREVGEFVGAAAEVDRDNEREALRIKTLEGKMVCSPGDWIIRGVKGEFYPCKPDIFAATYEPAEAGRADAARANELADALERAAAVASDAITGPVEVPITSGMMHEAAAWLRSRASAPPERERLISAIDKHHFFQWVDEQYWCSCDEGFRTFREFDEHIADAVLAALAAGGPAHAPPRML